MTHVQFYEFLWNSSVISHAHSFTQNPSETPNIDYTSAPLLQINYASSASKSVWLPKCDCSMLPLALPFSAFLFPLFLFRLSCSPSLFPHSQLFRLFSWEICSSRPHEISMMRTILENPPLFRKKSLIFRKLTKFTLFLRNSSFFSEVCLLILLFFDDW